MKNYFKLFGIIALAAIIVFSFIACNSDPESSDTAVTFSSLSANGNLTTTTTSLTLTFSKAIEGLTDANITLGGDAAITKGSLSGSGPSYTLGVTVTRAGTVTVSVSKSGYAISGSLKSTIAYRKIDWAAASFINTDDIAAIAWSGSRFVVGTRTNANIAYSPNGNDWTLVTTNPFTSPSDRVQSIAWGGNKFVAVARYGQMAYSSNGETWTSITPSPFGTADNSAQSITWGGAAGNEKFVAGGQKTKITYSSDGITWPDPTTNPAEELYTHPTSGTSHYVNNLTWGGPAGNQKFIAACFYGLTGNVGGGLYQSTDGVSWTLISGTEGDTAAQAYNGVVWGGPSGAEKFIACSDNGIIYSTDGITWTAASSPITTALRNIAWGGDRFIAVGASGKMAQSADGITWTEITDHGLTGTIYDITYGNNKFVACGVSGGIAYTE